MTRLLTTEARVQPQQFFQDILVANVRTHESNSGGTQGDFEADVAHDGSHHDVVFQLAMSLKVRGQGPQGCVAVNKVSLAIDKQRSIRIAVESDSEIRAFAGLLFRAASRYGASRSRDLCFDHPDWH